MRRYLLLVLLTFAACAADDHAETEPGLTRSCERAFATVVDAWRAKVGEVPAGCAFLDATVELQLVPVTLMPCTEPLGANQVRTECYAGGVIYLNSSLDDFRLVEAAVHGWEHATAECVDGDKDANHLRRELWMVYDDPEAPHSVESEALAEAEYGECL